MAQEEVERIVGMPVTAQMLMVWSPDGRVFRRETASTWRELDAC